MGGKAVYALGARGELVAASVESGAVLWRKELAQDHRARKPHYGFSASPRLLDGVLVLPLGGRDRAVAGFDARTGDMKWSAGTDAVAYQSPIVWQVADRELIVAAGSSSLFGLEARAGSVLWQYPHEGFGTRGADSLSPVAVGPDRLLLAHRDDGSTLIELDPASSSVRKVWESRAIRNSYALPVYHKGSLYAYSSRFLTCVDATTGESRWRSRAPGDGFPILVDGHLVIQTKEGRLHLARATPEGYEERAALALFASHSWTSPSFADGAIYARGFGEIARVDPEAVAIDREVEVQPEAPSGVLLGLRDQLREATDPEAVLEAFLSSQSSFPIVEEGTVHFVYQGQARDVALAGDLPGARREWPMSRMADTDLFFRSVSLEPDAAISYLFVVDYEPILDPRNPHRVRSSVYSSELEPVSVSNLEMSWLVMPGAVSPENRVLEDPQSPDARGTLESVTLPSRALNREIPLTVYRPPGYESGAQRYPVIYVMGGRGALDQGKLPRALDHWIGRVAQPLLAVFVVEGGFGALGPFADMFAAELVPFVDSKYRTLPAPESRAAVGMGWEALTAAYCTLRRPGIVGKMALQSIYSLTAPEGGPATWLSTPQAQSLEIYLDWGKYDLRNSHEAWSMADDSRRFYERMRQLGYAPAGGEVNAGAGWASWRNRTDRWLRVLFPLAETP